MPVVINENRILKYNTEKVSNSVVYCNMLSFKAYDWLFIVGMLPSQKPLLT